MGIIWPVYSHVSLVFLWLRRHRLLWCLRVCDQCGRCTLDCQNINMLSDLVCAHAGVRACVWEDCVSESTGGRRHQLNSPVKAHRARPPGSLGKAKPAMWGQTHGSYGGSGEEKTRIQSLNGSEMWELWAPHMGALSGRDKYGWNVEERVIELMWWKAYRLGDQGS